jgi:hypothetical protein
LENIAEPFVGVPLPEVIVVPDELARNLLLAAIGDATAPEVLVLPHLALEAAVAPVQALGSRRAEGVVALLLDPTEMSDGLGDDWRCTLQSATETASRQRATTRSIQRSFSFVKYAEAPESTC